jgi:hypothetical protein
MQVERVAIIFPNEAQIPEIETWLKPYSSLTHSVSFTTLAQAVPVISKLPSDMLIVADRFAEARGAILLKGLRKLCPNSHFIILATETEPIAELSSISRNDLNVQYFPQPWDMESLLAHIEAGVGKELPGFATAMVFDDEQIQKISMMLESLIEETAALSVYLVTSLGQVVDYKGNELEQIGEISSLLGGSFAALQQLGPTLNEQGVASNLIHRQGQHEDLYALSVGNDALLVLRFSITPTTPRIGTVALYARRAVDELAQLMAASHQKPTNPFGADGAQALSTELDQLFGDSNAEPSPAPQSKLLSFTGALRKGLVTKSLMSRWDSAHPEEEKNTEQGEE